MFQNEIYDEWGLNLGSARVNPCYDIYNTDTDKLILIRSIAIFKTMCGSINIIE